MTSPHSPVQRGNWGSRLAFILAAAGSAIGLGNIWRFPMVTAEGGGGAFVLVYIFCVALVGLPVMLAEMVVGRAGEKNPIGAFRHLAPGTRWHWIGGLGVVTAFVVLSFYSVIAGWTVYYVVSATAGTFAESIDTAEFFGEMVVDPGKVFLYHGLFMVVTTLIVAGGIRTGIERTIKVAMPILAVVLLVLLVQAVTLPGAGEGLAYYLTPKLSAITPQVVLQALAQAFFSLSLGMGAIITYGSYLQKQEDLPSSAVYVAIADTSIALLAGFIIFPALFFAGLSPDEGGPGLIFMVLPQVFAQLPWAPWGGILFGSAFFLLLAVAALTSAISLMEVVAAYLIDERHWSRKKAALTIGLTAFLVGLPSALSMGAVGWLGNLPGIGMSLLDLLSGPFMDFALVIGALGLSLFVGWKWGLAKALAEIREGSPGFRLAPVWTILIRYVAPLAIAVILAAQVYSLLAPEPTEPAEEVEEQPAH